MFKVAGISTLNGKTKVRFANDLVSRVKMLVKGKHEDITLVELPQAMDKAEIVTWLLNSERYMSNPVFAEAIKTANDKYNPTVVKVTKPSMESLVARAEAVNTQADEDMTEVNPS